jgi:hypothetical protein
MVNSQARLVGKSQTENASTPEQNISILPYLSFYSCSVNRLTI